MNDFTRDNEWQRRMRDTILVPQFYKKYAMEGRYVLLDKGRIAELLQRRVAVDTIVQGREGNVVAIEEKIVRFPKSGKAHKCFFLETESCTVSGYESDGWMVYGKADYLLYCFMQRDGSMVAYLIEFKALCNWFWPRFNAFRQHTMPDTLNKSRGHLVPTSDVVKNVPTWRFKFHAPEPAQVAA